MKRFLLTFFFALNFITAQDFVIKSEEESQPIKRGFAVTQNGSNQYEYVTPTLRMTGTYSLFDDFSDGNYTGWTVSSGAYVVDTLTNPLSSNRYNLKCNTAGVISIPMNQAYGRWRFQVYKGADANSCYYYFLHGSTDYTANNGYRFYIDPNEQIGLGIRTVATYMYTANSYVANGTWYEIEIERNTNGATSTYITGGAFTQKTLVSVTGGAGTNPFTNNTYTSSNYFVLDLDAGDRISNISCEYGEGSLDLNSFERIKHSDNANFANATGITWTNNGSYNFARSTATPITGTASFRGVVGSGDATTNNITLPYTSVVTMVAGEKYTLEFNSRDSSYTSGDSIYCKIGDKQKGIAFTDANTKKYVYNFQATSSTVNQNFVVWIKCASGTRIVKIDDFSVTQAWDMLGNMWVKSATTPVATKTILGLYTADGTRYFAFRSGVDNYLESAVGDGSSNAISTSTSLPISNDVYSLASFEINRTSNTKRNTNGVLTASGTFDISNYGKLQFSTLYVGKNSATTYFYGSLGETQITKFRDLSQSNVNANTLLSAYKWGLPKNWLTGIPVFNPKFKGTTLTQAGYDYSGAGNHLTFVNVTIADIIFGQGYNIK